MRWFLSRFWESSIGRTMLCGFLRVTQYRVFSTYTVRQMQFDLLRLEARAGARRWPVRPTSRRLHLGCGKRRVPGWWNVDVTDSDERVDLAGNQLPWSEGAFDTIVSQHVIEHLSLESEVIPLLRELRRITSAGGVVWLACPDLEKACRSYIEHRGEDLLRDRVQRHGKLPYSEEVPSSHFINILFCEYGDHRNLFDFGLLSWALERAGFVNCCRVAEPDLLAAFPEFPRRDDDAQSLYIRATAG